MTANAEKSFFESLGKFLKRISAPAGRIIDRIYARWLTPLNEKSDWINDADWARVQQEPLRARALLYGMALVLILLLLWAGFATLDEVARGEGRVIPSRQLQIVQ